MRFASFIAVGVFALTAAAQTTTATVATGVTTTSSGAAATDTAQTAIQACLAQCAVDDVNCKAHCIAVPSPDTSSVNATNQCVAACPKGNGTAADNTAYATCVNDCISQYYYSTSVGTPQSTAQGSGISGTSGTSAASVSAVVSAIVSTITSGGSTITTTVGSTTVSVTGSRTGSGSSASPTSSNAADAMPQPMGSSVGLLGFFFAALMAL